MPLFQDLQKLPSTEMHSRLADPSVRAEMLGQAEALVEEDSLQGRMVKMMFSNMAFYCECLSVFGSGFGLVTSV